MKINEELKKSVILAVDDNPTNLDVITVQLRDYGFTIIPVRSGEKALTLMERRLPDLILLDIMMPGGIDGFETCRRLKNNETTKNIPIIFMSALSDTVDKVTGFDLGAVDYITKPFQHEEVISRVSAHLTIRRQQKNLEKLNLELRELNASKDRFFSIIAHDLKNPLTVLIGMPEAIMRGSGILSKDEILELVGDMQCTSENMYALLENLLEWSRAHCDKITFQPEKIDLELLVAICIDCLSQNLKQKEIEVVTQVEPDTFIIVDRDMIETVVRNLLMNAIKFSMNKSKITILSTQKGNYLEITVSDTGVGISDEDCQKLFLIGEKIQSKGTAGEAGTGLGLILCKEFVEKNGGKIWIKSELDKGTAFTFSVPACLDDLG